MPEPISNSLPAATATARAKSPFKPGEGYHDFMERVRMLSETTYKKAADVPANREQIVLDAVHVTYDEVKTLNEAFEAVDGSEILSAEVREPRTGRTFITVDFGAGDNQYGAIFDKRTNKMVAAIIDGDLEVLSGKHLTEAFINDVEMEMRGALAAADLNHDDQMTLPESAALPFGLKDNFNTYLKQHNVVSVSIPAFDTWFSSYLRDAATTEAGNDKYLDAAEAQRLPRDLQDNYNTETNRRIMVKAFDDDGLVPDPVRKLAFKYTAEEFGTEKKWILDKLMARIEMMGATLDQLYIVYSDKSQKTTVGYAIRAMRESDQSAILVCVDANATITFVAHEPQ